MEDSGGRYGVELTAFGPYQMPGKSHEYAMEFQERHRLPGRGLLQQEHQDRRAGRVGGDVGQEIPAQVRLRLLPERGPGRVGHLAGVRVMKFPTKEA